MKRQRIELNAPQAGLNAAFADLSLSGLPAGPEPAPRAPAETKRGRVVLRRETAQRGGKTVLVVHDFAAHISADDIAELARELRNACGCGGTVRERTIELQGEPIAKCRAFLEAQGYQVAGVK